MASQVQEDNKSKRSDCSILAGLLQRFESSCLYDCTFKVGSIETGVKVFKCHKIILANNPECVFEKMFCGSFKEAKMGADEEIILDKVSPTTFHSAMKYLYGNITDFGDVSAATDIFLFAHQMQLLNLMEAVEEFLKSKSSPDYILAIYDAFKMADYKAGLEWSWKVIEINTSEALKSKLWEKVSADTVNDLLNAAELTVENETEIFEALCIWGQKQAEKRTDDEEPNDSEVRTVLEELLKLVKFSTMSCEEFSKLDMNSKILSTDVKHSIYQSIAQKSPQHLPAGYSAGGRVFLSAEVSIVTLPFQVYGSTFSTPSQATFIFKVSKRARLAGLQVHHNMGVVIAFHVFNEAMTEYFGNGHSQAKCTFEKKDYYAVLNSSILEPNETYKINFALNWKSIWQTGFMDDSKIVGNRNFKVNIPAQNSVHVTSLVFKMIHFH